MAEPPSSPQTLNPNPQPSESDNSATQPASAPPPPPLPTPTPTPAPAPVPATAPPPAPHPSFAPPISGAPVSVPPVAPSFRPVVPPQFSPLPGAVGFHNPGVPPPGISSAPGMVSGGVIPAVPPPMVAYQVPAPGQHPNPAFRQYMPMPNGYAAMPGAPQPPPGIPSYSPYPGMIRHTFAPRPPGPIGVLPAISRPPVPVVPGARPIIPPSVRPALVPVTPAEKPQTTVYVGKIAPSVENDYMLSLLQLCGPVKSWKRAQDPSNGAPKGFGFCEFESAEGVLRALRLLSKLNIDGQELVLNVNQATREYLERYVEKKRENAKKLNESEVAGVAEKEGDGASRAEKNESLDPSGDDSKKDDSMNNDMKNDDSDSGKKESHDNTPFGIVTDEDRQADKEASQKLTSMIEERLKTKPLLPPPPPPPPQGPAEVLASTGSEALAKSDSDADPSKNDAEERNDEETTSDNKATSEHDKSEINSPDRNRRYDRRSRERDRERDIKREKEREVERYEREAERERIRKEREQRRKIEEAEREYEERLKDWEYREREREKQRQYDRERDKERERKRKKEIIYDEEDEEDDSRKRWHRSVLEEKRKKRLREKEDDLADRRKEEEEIAEAKKRAEEEKKQQLQQQREALKLLNGDIVSRHEKNVQAEESTGEIVQHGIGGIADHEYPAGEGVLRIGVGDNSVITMAASDVQQNNNAPAKKLGFGLVGSGKRTAVPSVFYEEDDDDRDKEKKMRPLVPIDYSTEEMQAIQTTPGQSQPNLAAAAEFAKQLSNANMKEEKPESERERSRRSHDRSSQREKDRSNLDGNRVKDENRDKILERAREREYGQEKLKTTDNKKLLDAKQLIDMIPRTKEDLFSYEINWALYDQHELHERMRPWISKKIMEFLGEEETSLVDYIVTSTREHVKATEMLETLKSILDEEAEMFVLKMWRMLIFEIKKVETGLHLRSRS